MEKEQENALRIQGAVESLNNVIQALLQSNAQLNGELHLAKVKIEELESKNKKKD